MIYCFSPHQNFLVVSNQINALSILKPHSIRQCNISFSNRKCKDVYFIIVKICGERGTYLAVVKMQNYETGWKSLPEVNIYERFQALPPTEHINAQSHGIEVVWFYLSQRDNCTEVSEFHFNETFSRNLTMACFHCCFWYSLKNLYLRFFLFSVRPSYGSFIGIEFWLLHQNLTFDVFFHIFFLCQVHIFFHTAYTSELCKRMYPSSFLNIEKDFSNFSIFPSWRWKLNHFILNIQ